ncbi:MAG: NAD(P)-dependent oxidoreductase [Deltaproteobacteria bacterium]|nr:NAD(P)-dependent oxidoreductase [Deltaproteobacteria bacterium]
MVISDHEKTNLLITGGSGFLGTKLINCAPGNFYVHSSYLSNYSSEDIRLDITDSRSISKAFDQIKPEVVMHSAAYSDCNLCERKPDHAWEINVNGARNIAQACKVFGSKLVYISSSYIFDGTTGMYDENASPCPVNQLGRSKVAGEEHVIQNCSDAIIVRFSISYGYNGPNSNNGFFDRLIEQKRLIVDDSEIRQPPLIDDVAKAVFFLVEKGHQGIFHMGGPNAMTKYEMAKRLESIIRSTTLLSPGRSQDQITPRPFDVTLDCSKILRLGLVFKPIDQGLLYISENLK